MKEQREKVKISCLFCTRYLNFKLDVQWTLSINSDTYHLYSGFFEETVDVEIVFGKLVRRTCGCESDEEQKYAKDDVLSHCDSLLGAG